MALTDTEIHRIELLLTMDYLLYHTDENHPATQLDICRHGIKFGLKYDPKSTKGNDVRRDRIGDCLVFLYNLQEKNPLKIPFTLKKTSKGKYYLDKKFDLDQNHVVQILSAVKNDKYIPVDDSNKIVFRLLDLFSNSHNKEEIYSTLIDKSKKRNHLTISTARKLKILIKAIDKKKIVSISETTLNYNRETGHFVKEDIKQWYRVYDVKEFQNKPYVILLPIDGKGLVCRPVNEVNITNGIEREILIDDFDENRNLDELFRANNPLFGELYGTISNFVEESILPKGGSVKKCIFYFDVARLDKIQNSFHDFFSRPFEYHLVQEVKIFKGELRSPIVDKDKAEHAVVITNINNSAIISWLLSTPYLANWVTVVIPREVNDELARYYLHLLRRYQPYFRAGNLEITVNRTTK